MNPSITATALFTILAMATLPSSASALLFSPLLMRANKPWGIIARQARTKTVVMSPQVSQTDIHNSPSSAVGGVDFGHDEDLMRYKHELMGYVYEKSLTRGFDESNGQ
mmetsp:Transcript_21465/g.38457  ORF Transcript_21465/g.38457 Transcript_21465/m.38457 type:complete len:108 (-) Transcript_21465:372-695(-)|eukprot:CAMPEP_0201600578 /NCGR_PEP_ID=MMETSP0492-20130828/1589_1 /ASSEMBLY_ACC=CAM_ASM_000837 /TAXON_ID=420259 /ORGANISM="Thalassiosira gravida, Strain GMp14c1" /LENGTH=107 /DNA_ID=CAMNT_0048063357 /DNA_START=176 /DNA_END=499 /DNA_ORIENTATION=-